MTITTTKPPFTVHWPDLPALPSDADARKFWMEQRRILLEQVDNIERMLCMQRTSDIRAQLHAAREQAKLVQPFG